MNQLPTDYLTTECPNGHRVRGDLGWLNREVKCPHCHAKFLFARPQSQPADVVAIHSTNEGGPATKTPQRSGDWASDTGVMRIIGDYVPPPAETNVVKSTTGDNKSEEENTEPVDFREVHKVAFEDVVVRRVIRPRRKVEFLDINDSLERMQSQVRESMHSRYPVCDRSLDTILGVVHIKDILVADQGEIDIRSLLENVDEITDTTPVSQVLQHFHDDGVPMTFVVDEYDNMIGIVTLKDVLSKLV